MRKNFWVTVFCAVLAAVVAVSVVFIVQGVQKKNAPAVDKTNTTYSVEYLQSEYNVGEQIVYHFVVYSDIEFKALSYKLGTSDEQSVDNVKTGKSKDLKDVPENVGDYYVDTKVQIIDSSELKEGYYTVIFYGYDKDNNRYELNKEPYSFKLVVAETETVANNATQTPAGNSTETPAAA